MKNQTFNKPPTKKIGRSVAMLAILTPLISQAALTGPYTADANTLHLYHLDQAVTPLTDSGSAATLYDLTNATSTLGASSYSGFGTALSFSVGNQEAKSNVGSPQSDWQGASGSFTYEALINDSTAGGTQTIMARDHTTGGPNLRSFIFRLNGSNIEFINTGAAGNQTLAMALPSTGFNAFAVNTWFQIAVTYNGTENTAGNFSFYFTKVDPSVTTANLLGTAQLTLDVGNTGGNSVFDVGNRDAAATGGFLGSIDEVRVSDIARTANQFIFAPVPEPSAMAICGLGFAGLLAFKRFKK